MEDFFKTVLTFSPVLLGALYVLRHECVKNFDKIEGTLGDEWYRIQSYIWSTDLKNTVGDLTNFIKDTSMEFHDSGSMDPLFDVFSDARKYRIIKSRLNEIKSAYDRYLNFNEILVNYHSENELLKKWLDIALLNTLVMGIWSVIGIFLISKNLTLTIYYEWHWNAIYVILLAYFCILFKTIFKYNNVNIIKHKVREEKANYANVLHDGG